MKNIYLYRHLNTAFHNLNNVKVFCIDSQSENIYVCCNNIVHKLSVSSEKTENICDFHQYYDIDIPAIIHISMNPFSSCLCMAFEIGDILTYDFNSNEIQCVGSVESGLKAVQWSPDQEVIVIVTGNDTIIVMTSTFDPVIEVDLHQSSFGEKQFIAVGWGKKETQFHGSEGKAAARSFPKSAEISVFDDGKPQISWRGDGNLFAISAISPLNNSRQIRIFSRDGILQYTSESASGLEGFISWRPSGNLIATSQRLPNKHVIAFFEKNGLRHGEFSLPFPPDKCKIRNIAWNCESTILAIWSEYLSDEFLQLWTVNNYHWYLKQTIKFTSEKKLLGIEWDMLHGNRLHILCEGLHYTCYDWAWIINCSKGITESDGAFVAVIDEDKVLLTAFRNAVIPPPFCKQTMHMTLPVNNIIFASSKKETECMNDEEHNHGKEHGTATPIDSNAFCAILSDGSIVICTYLSTTKCHEQLTSCKINGKNMADFHHWLWLKNDVFICCHTCDSISYLAEITLNLSKSELNIRKEIATAGLVTSIVATPDNSGAIIQLTNGSLFIYNPSNESLVQYSKPLPESCENLQIRKIDGNDVTLGLSSHNRLYVDAQEVANNITSMSIHSEFILLTTLRHTLLCIEMNDKGIKSLINGKFGQGRRIERGARLVTSVASDTSVILQMPRGNLECIQPRSLTLHIAACLLDSMQYGAVFQIFKKQRINLNLLCDHQSSIFLANVDKFVEELKDPMWLSLFLSDLQDENVTHDMYKDYYSNLDELPNALDDKVRIVCDAVREAILRRNDIDKYLLPILTSHVQKKTDKDLSIALLKVKEVREEEKVHGKLKVTADEALKYLLYLVDVNSLYDVALGLYDFDLVMLVAAKSNKDPKEYLPFLNELHRMEPNYRFFMIDKHLKRYDSALKHIAQCPGEDNFTECISLIKTHQLYAQALNLFSKDSSRYLKIAEIYGSYLQEKKLYQEAGIMYIRAKKYKEAIAAYELSGDWQEALLAAKHLQFKENKFNTLCHNLVLRLKGKRQFKDAAEILCKHLGVVEDAIAVLVQGRLWNEAIWLSFYHNREDLIETYIRPGIMEHLEHLTSQITNIQEQFKTHSSRLQEVRLKKEQLQFEEKEDVPEGCDTFSDTSSIFTSTYTASHTGSRFSGRTHRSQKNRRKLERKMLSLKKGNPYEDLALIRALHELITAANNNTDDVRNVCQALLRFDQDKEAADLQKLLGDVIKEMEKLKHNIWTVEFMQQTEMSYGPDETVNSITSKMQSQSNSNRGFSLLEPVFRFPPTIKNSGTWQISILKTD